MSTAPILEEPPQSASITDYDRAHFKLLMRLVEAEDDGARWEEAVQVLFGIDADKEPERALRVHQSHLARAHWLIENGFDVLRRQSMN